MTEVEYAEYKDLIQKVDAHFEFAGRIPPDTGAGSIRGGVANLADRLRGLVDLVDLAPPRA